MKRFKTLYILATLISFIFAQEQDAEQPIPPAGAEETEPVLERIIEFSVYIWPQNQVMGSGGARPTGMQRAFYMSPTGMEQIYIRRGTSTPLKRFQGEGPLILFDYVDTMIPVPEGAPEGTRPTFDREIKPLVEVEIPEDLKRMMIIVLPGRKNQDGTFLSAIMPYGAENFDPGMARVHNNTKKTLALKFPGETENIVKINPNGTVTFSPQDMANGKNPRVIIYSLTEGNRLRALYTDRLVIDESSTNLFMIFPQGRRVRILRLGGHKIED